MSPTHAHLPVSFFGMAVGSLAWGHAWRAAADIWVMPSWLPALAAALGLAVWLIVLLAYARALLRLEAGDEAESLLRKALGRHWDPRLVALYAELDVAAPAILLGRAETWLATHPGDAQLLLALGQLGYRAALWGKARAYLEDALAHHPSALAHRLLADVYDRLDEPALAQRQRALGLELATAGANALLPAP